MTSQTYRQRLIERLSQGPATVHGLALELGLPIAEVVRHLEHVRRSLRDRRLLVEPATCVECGFVFSKRERFTAPSRCPICRSESTTEPELRIG